jgi:protein TonB
MKVRLLYFLGLFVLLLSAVLFAEEPVRVKGSSKAVTILKKVPPAYPAEAKKEKVQGKVVLDVTIDKQGKVMAVKTVETAHPALEEAAVTAIKQWEYAPIIMDGKAVSVIATVTINFALEEGKEKPVPAK